jgi:hypothetical protein
VVIMTAVVLTTLLVWLGCRALGFAVDEGVQP